MSADPDNDSAHDARLARYLRGSYQRTVAALTSVVADRSLAEEAVAEGLARAVDRLGRGRTIDDLDAWVYVVARNYARGRTRRLRRTSPVLPDAPQATDPDSDTANEILSALRQLPNRQREVLVLHYYLDLTFRDISERLGVTEGAVKNAAHNGKARLRVLLTEEADRKA